MVPTLLDFILEELDSLPIKKEDFKLKYVITSGETLTIDLGRKFFDKLPLQNLKLLNFYGSTEIMGDVTFEVFNNKNDLVTFSESDKLSIGKPISNISIEIRKTDNNQEFGELFIYGKGVNSGYYVSESTESPSILNYDKFFPVPGELLNKNTQNKCQLAFRTGDLGKIHEERIIYFGRSDTQIKIKGNRFDLTENRKLFNDLFNISSVSLFINDKIVIFVNEKIPENILEIEKHLPSYALPSEIIYLPDNFPLIKSSGKIDNQKLIEIYENQKQKKLSQNFLEYFANFFGLFEKYSKEFREKCEILIKVFYSMDILIPNYLISSFFELNFSSIGGSSLVLLQVIKKLTENHLNISLAQFMQSKNFLELLNSITHSSPTLNDGSSQPFQEITLLDFVTEERRKSIKRVSIKQLDKDEVIQMVTDGFIQHGKMEIAVHQFIPEKMAEFKECYKRILNYYWDNFLDISFAFVDEINGKTIITGVVLLTSDLARENVPELADNGVLESQWQLCYLLEAELSNLIKKHNITKDLYGWIFGVNDAMSTYDKISIMVLLEQITIEVGKSNGYELLVVTNTNDINTQLAQLLGYHKMAEMYLKDMQLSNGEFPFKASEPSIKAVSFYKLLQVD